MKHFSLGLFRFTNMAIVSLGLSACSYLYVPVDQIGEKSQGKPAAGANARPSTSSTRTSSTSPSSADAYTIKPGDTLFSIAMRYDLDYKALAETNDIESPYVIYPDQVIRLSDAGKGNQANNQSAATTVNRINSPVGKAGSEKTGIAGKNGVNINQGQASSASGSAAKDSAKTVMPVAVAKESQWIWPVNGKVIRQFSPQDSLSKGIDISADLGKPISSSRSGVVVYAGSGLKGYGNLVIIRHDDVYISAYAHNKSIFVKEGQTVRQGDKIAELGMSGTETPKLHFEIRKQGKPIDPLGLLPKI